VELGLLLAHGSLALLLLLLLVAGIGVPIPEDLVLLAAGALSHRSGVSLFLTIAVCYMGVVGGDSLVFWSGRRLGNALFERRMFRRLLTPARRRRIEGMFERRGSAMVFFARYMAGIRPLTFALAGMHGMEFRRFLFWDALAACISVPTVTVLGFVASQHIEQVAHGVHRVGYWIAGLVALAAVVYALSLVLRRERSEAS
jgi:membrane protein DedA with SNARE-associated domain